MSSVETSFMRRPGTAPEGLGVFERLLSGNIEAIERVQGVVGFDQIFPTIRGAAQGYVRSYMNRDEIGETNRRCPEAMKALFMKIEEMCTSSSMNAENAQSLRHQLYGMALGDAASNTYTKIKPDNLNWDNRAEAYGRDVARRLAVGGDTMENKITSQNSRRDAIRGIGAWTRFHWALQPDVYQSPDPNDYAAISRMIEACFQRGLLQEREVLAREAAQFGPRFDSDARSAYHTLLTHLALYYERGNEIFDEQTGIAMSGRLVEKRNPKVPEEPGSRTRTGLMNLLIPWRR